MKKLGVILFSIALIAVMTGTVAAKPRWINELTLQYTDGTPVAGALAPGFMLYYEDAPNEFYYLDVATIDPPPPKGEYAFYLKTAPIGPYFEYMESRGVTADAEEGTWQAQMWLIITKQAPMFYLVSDGQQCDLIDGLQYAMGDPNAPLRINKDYLVGTYHFLGDVDGARTMIKLFFAD
jgi:hypothetical protein